MMDAGYCPIHRLSGNRGYTAALEGKGKTARIKPPSPKMQQIQLCRAVAAESLSQLH